MQIRSMIQTEGDFVPRSQREIVMRCTPIRSASSRCDILAWRLFGERAGPSRQETDLRKDSRANLNERVRFRYATEATQNCSS